ncbi:MAG: hypothetical protein AB8G22_21580, partial [Saprospiraceae bacterium]
MKFLYSLLSITFVVFTSYHQLSAEIININFTSATPNVPTSCLDTWSESDLNLQVVPIPPDTDCFFELNTTMGYFDMYTGRVTVDLSSLTNISNIDIDILDFCGEGCTIAKVWNAGNVITMQGNADTGNMETLSFSFAQGTVMDQFSIESFEGRALKIRIQGDRVGNNQDLDLGDGTLQAGTYTSCNGITSQNQLTGDVVFMAGTQIELGSGFSTGSNT